MDRADLNTVATLTNSNIEKLSSNECISMLKTLLDAFSSTLPTDLHHSVLASILVDWNGLMAEAVSAAPGDSVPQTSLYEPKRLMNKHKLVFIEGSVSSGPQLPSNLTATGSVILFLRCA
jgi:hypothetical protein